MYNSFIPGWWCDKMPVDFMTKPIKHDKMIEQLNYVINKAHAVWPG